MWWIFFHLQTARRVWCEQMRLSSLNRISPHLTDAWRRSRNSRVWTEKPANILFSRFDFLASVAIISNIVIDIRSVLVTWGLNCLQCWILLTVSSDCSHIFYTGSLFLKKELQITSKIMNYRHKSDTSQSHKTVITHKERKYKLLKISVKSLRRISVTLTPFNIYKLHKNI